MDKETIAAGAHFDFSNGPSMTEIIAHLAWLVEQPNGHPLCLYEPLILAIGRRLAKYRRRSRAQARMLRYVELPAPKDDECHEVSRDYESQ